MNQPQPDLTADGPSYEGRLLPRPDDEVVDQGLQFDVTTLFSRRRVLGMLGIGAGVATLAACGANASSSDPTRGSSASTGTLTEIPDETNGPYPADGTNGVDVLEESGIVRQDIRSSFGDTTTTAEGIPLTFEFTVLDMANDNAPFTDVAVYAWHCNRAGLYSMYSEAIRDENYLRGVQIADADGKVSFTSIFPACYSGRWPHIHFEVYPDEASITNHDKCIATSQMAMRQDACDAVYATEGYEASVTNLSQVTLESDSVFGDDGGATQLATMTGGVTDGYTATLIVPIDTATEPTSGSAPSGGGTLPSGAPSGGPGGTPPSGGPQPSSSTTTG